MTITTNSPVTDLAPTSDTHVLVDRPSDLGGRAAGLGAIGFASLVVAQNLLRSSAPQPGDEIADVVAHFADHRAVTVALLVTFVASLCCLATFVGGSARRLLASSRPGFAALGFVGVATVIALFSGVVASEQALSVISTSSDPDLGAAHALWTLHNSVFTVNMVFIALALVGLSRAGIAAGITPRWFRRVAPVGGALLALGTAAGPMIAAGDAPAAFALSVIGFATWLTFLIATGLRLVRGSVR